MKYSLRSLMIVVTLVCVVLGGVMGRVEYLRRRGAFHDREKAMHLAQWRQEYESRPEAWLDRERALYFHHKVLAIQYREAIYRPWTLIDETATP